MANKEDLQELVSDKKVFETRLALKTDTLANWRANGTKKLLPGEIGIITAASSQANGSTEPVTMLIVGDGTHTINQLIEGWDEDGVKKGAFSFYARASDVIAQAKDVDQLKNYILSLSGDIVKKLDEDNGTYVKKGDYDKDYKYIDNRVEALENDDRIATILEGANSSTFKELEDKISQNSIQVNSLNKIIGDEEDNSGLIGKVKSIEGWKNGIANVMDFRGAFAVTVDENSKEIIEVIGLSDITKGDVITVTSGELGGKEFVYDGTKWIEIGDVSAQNTAISNLQNTVDSLENTIEGLDNIYEEKGAAGVVKSEIQSQINEINSAIGNAISGANDYTDGEIRKLSEENGAIYELKSSVEELQKLSLPDLVENKSDKYVIFNCGSATINI